MDKSKQASRKRLLTAFTDVLYLTNSGQIPYEVRRLLKQKGLSYVVLPVDEYSRIPQQRDLIGTVIIDGQDMEAEQTEQLGRVVESLELENIGVIFLTSRVNMPVKSFSISPPKSSFSMSGTTEAVSIDDLWVQISVNLACRKRSSGMAIKPAHSVGHSRVYKNKLAEQLKMTQSLIESLAEQLQLAGRVQQDFLPTRLPSTDTIEWASAYVPAEWVSGDIYTVDRIDEEHIGFYLADVVGHGMPAALLTIFLKQALVMRETVGHDYTIFSPAEVMQHLNVRMAAQKLSGYQFATCCYCLLDTQTLELTYSRAGHPYPILMRAGEEPRQLEVRGPLLGIFEQAEFLQAVVQLQPGDKLLIYSDGAERFIGGYDDNSVFHFADSFLDLQDAPIGKIIDKLKVFANNVEVDSPEVDDITAVGLEVH